MNVDHPVLNTIELCAGVGMLGVGVAAGLRHMGIESRCILYAEREAYPAGVLAARIEEGSLDAAPIWFGDFRDAPFAELRGVVDCIVAGFPCQDLSLAGKRAGLDGQRSGLFFDILDAADSCGAAGLVLENVAGIASATASVVDEAEGDLEERAAARVLGELADRGWDAEWLTLSASDVGASHGRERWFCLAWRQMGHAGWNARSAQHGQQSEVSGGRAGEPSAIGGIGNVDDAQRAKRRQACATGTGGQQGDDGRRAEAHGGAGEPVEILEHTPGERCRETGQCGAEGAPGTGEPDAGMAHASQHGRHQGRPESSREQGRPDAAECGGAVADPRCSDARRIKHITGASGIEAEHQPCSCPMADTECPLDRSEIQTANCRQPQAIGPTNRACGHSNALADTSSAGRQGSELGRALHGNRGGGSTWTS